MDITTIRNFILEFLNFDINSDIQPADWLTFPEQIHSMVISSDLVQKKLVELAVRNVVHGRPVKNVDALANPEALEQFRDRVELKS